MIKFNTLIVILTASLSAFTQAATYGGGTGTAEDPYQIWTPQQMNTIGTNPADWDKSFKLMADIDMSIYTGTQYNIIGSEAVPFSGTLDGGGHKINSLTYMTNTISAGVGYIGLLGYASHAVIKNLNLEQVDCSALYDRAESTPIYIGTLAGYLDNCTIINCSASGAVESSIITYLSCIGGLAGSIDNSVMLSCRSDVAVNASVSAEFVPFTSALAYAGGLVGNQNGGSMISCRNTGNVAASASSYRYSHTQAGGIAGNQFGGIITSCCNTGAIDAYSYSVESYGKAYAGGIAGANENSSVSFCLNTGSVTSEVSLLETYSTIVAFSGGIVGYQGPGSQSMYNPNKIISSYNVGSIDSIAPFMSGSAGISGGLVGFHYVYQAAITFSYNAGPVSSSGLYHYSGGLVGESYSSGASTGKIQYCTWDMETSGQSTDVGHGTAMGITGKTTAQMKTLLTFISDGWDFTNETTNGTNDIWRMCTDGVDYPRLNWESTDGDFACPNGVNIEDLDYFISRWLMTSCTVDNNYCALTDLNFSGTVNLADLSILAANWLKQ